jgi:uncharacterized protein (TIGR02391 family)
MNTLLDLLPGPDEVLSLEPEELAGFVMEYLHSLSGQDRSSKLMRNNFGGSLFYHPQWCPPAYQGLDTKSREKVTEAVMEAWFWLEREGFLAPQPGPNRDTFFITRRGERVKNAFDLQAARKSDLLPKKLLHPIIGEKTSFLFLRGEYDTTVFQAFKEVEVAVREAGGYEARDLGVDLVRKAFDPSKGPLTNQSRPKAEREALAHLFAGAIGSYKNPSSHRKVALTAEETVEMLMLASHLLRIVDSLVQKISNKS